MGSWLFDWWAGIEAHSLWRELADRGVRFDMDDGAVLDVQRWPIGVLCRPRTTFPNWPLKTFRS